MKKISGFLVFIAFWFPVHGQYVTPGTGVNWTIDDLVQNSQGVIIINAENDYEILQDFTLSTGDTLSFHTAATIVPHENVLITVNGIVLTMTGPQEQIIFTGQNNGDLYYKGFRFENTTGSVFIRTNFYHAGGIKMVNAKAVFTDCLFSAFNQDNCTGSVDLFQSDPVFNNCSFTGNSGPAVLSAANGTSSPQIIDCNITGNVTANINMPQINLGTSGEDSIRIVNCVITGGGYDQSGGIAIATLAGGEIKCRIEQNHINENRYGIVQYGNNIGSVIKNNEIRDNNIQGNPNLGGSGLNFFGDQTNTSVVTGNTITGNLWGITIQNQAKPDFGNLASGNSPGLNLIFSNGNNGEVYDMYNNTPGNIMAENNYWGTMDPATVELHIVHQPDDPTLGFVDYLPLYDIYTGVEATSKDASAKTLCVYPNPAGKFVIVESTEKTTVKQPETLRIFNCSGTEVFSKTYFSFPFKINLDRLPDGLYIAVVSGDFRYETLKIVVQHK